VTVPPAAPRPRERILTLPLVTFLAGVAALLAGGWWQRQRLPDLEGAILELADGDLDAEERQRVLAHVVDCARAPGATDPRAIWAGVLAAVSLEDRAAHAALTQRLAGGTVAVPPPAERAMLDLGEPVLGHLLQAAAAEARGERSEARRWWGTVLAEARLEGRGLARELAEAGLARLRE
jgi:hypothetical protein